MGNITQKDMKLLERIADKNSITALRDRLPPELLTQPFYRSE